MRPSPSHKISALTLPQHSLFDHYPEPFSKHDAARSGIEATISQGVRAFDLRRSRSIGLAKTHLPHVSMAAAINMGRGVAWLDGDELAPTRVSAFQRLYSAA
jgi:transposase